ncbi:MAG: hypothetical protein HN351_04565 [Deltaproteobacteria bacterium]|nr:hypothetical protein [Deltaproteobacteria bacterium]
MIAALFISTLKVLTIATNLTKTPVVLPKTYTDGSQNTLLFDRFIIRKVKKATKLAVYGVFQFLFMKNRPLLQQFAASLGTTPGFRDMMKNPET